MSISKPRPAAKTREDYYTDREVELAMNNTIIAVLRWVRLRDCRNIPALAKYAAGLAEVVRENLDLVKPEELVLALMSAAALLYYSDAVPEAEEQRESFVRQLTRARPIPQEAV